MKEKKKYSTTEITAFIFCLFGCLMMIAPRNIDTDIDLFSIALALNGIGISLLLFGKKAG